MSERLMARRQGDCKPYLARRRGEETRARGRAGRSPDRFDSETFTTKTVKLSHNNHRSQLATNSFATMDRSTSLITILSTAHGQLRREQRDIDKRDLKRALKYGRCERAYRGRWKIDFDGITFITDQSKHREVTAFPSPLQDVPIDRAAIKKHNQVKNVLKQKPELATSHTILVIDNSGSMLAKKNDVHLYRDSQNAAFSMTALEFIAEQLLSQTAVNSDLVSLVKFSSVRFQLFSRIVQFALTAHRCLFQEPTVEFSREPIGWPVYNQILSHRNTDRFVDRQTDPFWDEMCGQSNFLPTLAKVGELLQLGHHVELALSVFFFSDGRSSDHKTQGISCDESYKQMKDLVKTWATAYGESLTFTAVGLGNCGDDFEALKAMAMGATLGGAKGSFERCDRTAHSLTSAISSMVSSTTESRVTLQTGGKSSYTERSGLASEKVSFPKLSWRFYKILDHYIYDPRAQRLEFSCLMPLAAAHTNPEEVNRRLGSNPPYLAINANYFGKGAERVAFRCRLADESNTRGFVFEDMIAKETKHDQRIEERIEFHKSFAETQDLANYLANQFNAHIRGIPGYDPLRTPVIRFVSCSVLVVEDHSAPGGSRGVLVEKMLDTESFRWTKWNDNAGRPRIVD